MSNHPIHIHAFLGLIQMLTQKRDDMRSKDPRPSPFPDRLFPMTIMLIVLCGYSFYLGGLFFPMRKLHTKDVSQAVQLCEDVTASLSAKPTESQLSKAVTSASLQVTQIDFPECSGNYNDYTPCTDPKVCFIIFAP